MIHKTLVAAHNEGFRENPLFFTKKHIKTTDIKHFFHTFANQKILLR